MILSYVEGMQKSHNHPPHGRGFRRPLSCGYLFAGPDLVSTFAVLVLGTIAVVLCLYKACCVHLQYFSPAAVLSLYVCLSVVCVQIIVVAGGCGDIT